MARVKNANDNRIRLFEDKRVRYEWAASALTKLSIRSFRSIAARVQYEKQSGKNTVSPLNARKLRELENEEEAMLYE